MGRNFPGKGDFMDETFTVTDGRLVCHVSLWNFIFTPSLSHRLSALYSSLKEDLPLSINAAINSKISNLEKVSRLLIQSHDRKILD